MATIRVFEELDIWQMADRQCQKIYELIEDGRFDFDTPLATQINHSSGSVMDNIAKGFDRFSKADFRYFLIIARGANAEVCSQIHRAKSRKHITYEEAAMLIQEARHLGIKINSLIQYLDKSIYKTKPKQDAIAEPESSYFISETLLYDLPEEFLTLTFQREVSNNPTI